jgi:hypothetical protein
MYTKRGVVRESGNLPAVPGTIAGHRIPVCILHYPHVRNQESNLGHPDDECSCQEAGMLISIPEPADLRR